MAQIIPMMMNPETRKASSNVGKILLVFGVLGVGIIAFIYLSKVFKPFKAIGDFFGNVFKGVGGFFKGALSGLGGVLGGVGSILEKKKDETVKFKIGVDPGVSARQEMHGEYTDWYGEGGEQARREFRRYGKQVIRELGVLKESEGVPMAMAGRISLVQSAFRRVDSVFVRDIAKQFEVVWDRKREFLRGNLVEGFTKAEIEVVAKRMHDIGARYGVKVARTQM